MSSQTTKSTGFLKFHTARNTAPDGRATPRPPCALLRHEFDIGVLESVLPLCEGLTVLSGKALRRPERAARGRADLHRYVGPGQVQISGARVRECESAANLHHAFLRWQ